MSDKKQIESALLSVYNKDHLAELATVLHQAGVQLISTGGTFDFLHALNIPVKAIEEITSYPAILGGRVKTLHPKVFGGILNRRAVENDLLEIEQYDIPNIDLVVVDLYPFEETVASNATEQEIIEKIDIGGVSLIRAAAKNFKDVAVICESSQYSSFIETFNQSENNLDLNNRKKLATRAFQVIAQYDSAISTYFSKQDNALRYGENPHQQAFFAGRLSECFTQLNGKALSYNNLLDVDSAVSLISEFQNQACAIIKHNNACGFSLDDNQVLAYQKALAGDPVSAFGGVVILNRKLEKQTAEFLNQLFFEVLIAPDFDEEALNLLKSKTNRIILKLNDFKKQAWQSRSVLNGVLWQTNDETVENFKELKTVTHQTVNENQWNDLEIAVKVCKNSKSNAVSIIKNGQLVASGVGQTSRVDALNHAIEKANIFGIEISGAVMASEAFFPFPDCVEIAAKAGITAIAQPGGSIKDQLSIDKANELGIAMVFTGTRHFKH